MLLFWTPAALAHLPHDDVSAVAVAPDFAASGRAVALVPIDGSVGVNLWAFGESDDGGERWTWAPGPPVAAPIIADNVWVVWTPAGQVVVGPLGDVWKRVGAVWRRLPGPGVARALGVVQSGDRIALLSSDGVWYTDDPAGDWTLLPRLSVIRIAIDPMDPTVLALQTGRRTVMRWDTDEAEGATLPEAEQDLLDIGVVDSRIYAGFDGGLLRGEDGAWAACGGPNPAIPDPGARYVGHVATNPDGSVWAGTGQSLFSSTDRCASFTEHIAFAEVPDYEEWDTTYGDAYRQSFQRGERTLAIGYRGMTHGLSGVWSQSTLLYTNIARAVAFAAQYPADPHLWIASYGGGVSWTGDGGRTWGSSATGLQADGPFGRTIVSHAGVLLWGGDLWPSISLDGGRTFSDIALPTGRILRFVGGNQVWAIGNPIDGTSLARSDDGLAWTLLTPPDGTWSQMRESVVGGRPALLVPLSSPAGALVSYDAGDSFQAIVSDGGEVIDIVAWPPRVGSRLVRANLFGISVSDDGGGTWTASDPGPQTALLLTVASDGTLFALDVVHQVWRSTSAGARWERVREPTPGGLALLEVAPDFARSGVVIVAGYAGTWVSSDRGDTWGRLQSLHRVEVLDCWNVDGGACGTWSSPAAGNGGGVTVEPGGFVQASTLSSQLRWIGEGDPLELLIDGAPIGPLAAGVWADLVTGSWHTIQLRAGTATARVDALELAQEGTTFTVGAAAGAEDSGVDSAVGADSAVGTDSVGGADSRIPAYDGGPDSALPKHEEPGCGCAVAAPPGVGGRLGFGLGLGLLAWRRRARPRT